jgi:CubicO group peptidase (beta-lactamase class C family)
VTKKALAICSFILLSTTFGLAAKQDLFFAQYGGGQGFTSDLVLTNPSPKDTVSGRVDFYGDDGNPLLLTLAGVAGETPVSGTTFSLAPLGSLTVRALAGGSLQVGSAVVRGDGPLGGVVRFQVPGMGVAGVPASRPVSAFVIPARREAGGIRTGVAVHNPVAEAVRLDLTLRDGAGAILAAGVVENLAGHGHLARFVEELFAGTSLPEFEGTLTVEVKTGTVAATSLEMGAQAGELTALPVSEVVSGPSGGETPLPFAQFGNGGGLRSALVLVNPHRSEAVSGSAEFFDDQGQALAVGMAEGSAAVSSVPFTIGPLGSVTLWTDGAGELQLGSARATASLALAGIIRYEIAGFGTTAVPAGSATSGCLVPVRLEANVVNTGVALQNLGETSLELELILRDGEGKQPPGGQARIETPGRGHVARFVNELFPHAGIGPGFVGTVSVENPQGSFTAASLEMGVKPGEVTTLPVTPLEGRSRRATTVGAFDITAGYVVLSLDNAASGARRRFHYGESYPCNSLVSPVAGDFDGDGQTTLGFFNYREARFYLANSNVPGVVDQILSFVPPNHDTVGDPRGWIAIAGDWTGAGFDQLGLYDWRTSTFYFLDAQGQLSFTLQFGDPRPTLTDGWPGGPFPLAGDWDGDGVDTIGLCYLGPTEGPNTFYLKNNLSPGPADMTFEFGPVQGYPLGGDWDGDGLDTIGLFDSITKTFYFRNSNSGGPPEHSFVLDEGPFFECLVCNRLPPATIPGVFPVAGEWSTKGDASPKTGYDWPIDSPENHGLSSARLEVARQQGEQLPHLRSLLVVRHGSLVWESYFHGYDGTITQNIKSVSKSVLSSLFGIAYDQGLFPKTDLDPIENLRNIKIASFFPEFPDVSKDISLLNLMTMTAGLEIHGDPPAEFVLSPDWITWVLSQPMSQSDPLGKFNYTTCLTQVGSEILTRVTGMPTLDFAKKYLFEPLGISVTRWDHEPNPRATYVGGWEMFMRPRDMARFGQLFLHGGRIEDDKQLISSIWVASSSRELVTSPMYGLWWWIGGNWTLTPPTRYYYAYYANGLGGQRIFVFPSLDMLVVMTSQIPTQDPSGNASANHTLLRYVLDALVE